MVTQNAANVLASGSSTGPPTALLWPTGIVAGDTLVLVVLHNNGSALTGTGSSGTGIVVPAGFVERTDWGSPYTHNAATGVSTYTKTAVGGESGTSPAVRWGGGTGGSSSKVFIVAGVVPVGRTLGPVAFTSAEASGTNPSVPVAAVTHTGADEWITIAFEKGSSPSTSYSATPAGTTGAASDFGTGGGASSGAWARSTAVDRDGTVGSGTWTTNTSNTAARLSLTVVTTLERVTKTQATTWNTRARVVKTTSTTYDVRARVPKTLSTTWNVRARVAKSTATTWDVAGSFSRIAKTQATTWNVAARVVKTTATTWDVAAALSRIAKTQATTWNVRARVVKTQATTWNTRARVTKALATTWNLASMLSEATWPAFMAHRGGDPGPEETMYAYDAAYTRSPRHWHEMDCQTLNDGTTVVANHDDTVDRMYSSGPVATGNVSAISPTNWDLEFWRVNTGYTGSARQAMRVSAWVTKYGKGPGVIPVCGLLELKAGNDMADLLATLGGCQGSVLIECATLADCDLAIAAGYDAVYWRPAGNPIFSEFTSHGIKYLIMDYNDMTGTIATNAIAAGVKVIMYTVNSTANRDAMLALFSDDSYAGFLSNKPATIDGTNRITKTTATTWNVRSRVAKTTATTWNVRSRPIKTQATTYDVRARLAKTTATTWGVRSRVAKTTATTWNTRARVTKATSTTWDTAGSLTRVSKAQATTWNVRSRAVKTQATTWDTRARLVKATTTDWNVRARAAKTTSTSWHVLQRVTATRSTTWNVLTPGVITVAPEARTYVVRAETRTHAIEGENRTRIIPAESRTLEVAP